MAEPTPIPTQVKRPWRTTLRTVFQFVVALATLLPFIAGGVYSDVDQAPAVVGQVLAVAAAITRIMALQQVEAFLQQFLPFLAATPRPILGKAVAGDLPTTTETPGGMRAPTSDPADGNPHRY